MALSTTDSEKYVLGLPLEFLEQLGVKLPANAWSSLFGSVEGTALVPYRPVLIYDLVIMTETQLLNLRGMGKQNLNSIKYALSKLHISLGMKDLGPVPSPEERLAAAVRHQLLPPKHAKTYLRIPRFRSERDQKEIRIFFHPPRFGELEIGNLQEAQDATTKYNIEVIGRLL